MAGKNTDSSGFILIVEDDRGTNNLEAGRLEPLGMEIRSAYSAREAVEILKGSRPELVLLDYSLPEMSAFELLAELKNSEIQMPPFIVVTGRGDERLAVEAMKSGAQDYIAKDSALLDNLLDRVKTALENARLKRGLEKAKRLAEEERDRYKLFFDSAGDAAFVYGAWRGGAPANFVEVNDAACAQLGYSREELLKLGPEDIGSPDTADQRRKAGEALARDGRAVFESVHLAKDGRAIPVEVSSRVFDYRGAKFVLSLARDITGRKR